MKYLYKILRLFFCPHKYVQKEEYSILRSKNDDALGVMYIKECKYCGKNIKFNSYI